MKKTIIVLTIETDKVPPKELANIIENRAHDALQNKGLSVSYCVAAMKTTDKPE